MITQAELSELFIYCDDTGNLIRKVNSGPAKAGDIAGGDDGYGYVVVRAKGKKHKAHRLVWIMIHGSIDPKLQVDHINQVKGDNRISNLRLVTRHANMKNRPKVSTNTSGHTGVYWNKRDSRWHTTIRYDGKKKHIGYFISKEDAIKASEAASIEYGFHENHGR